jgi:hypothetical protein
MDLAKLRVRGLALVWTAVLVAVLAPASLAPAGLAADDVTPPVGTFPEWGFDDKTGELLIHADHEDPESGVVSVGVSCEGGPEVLYPYAETVRVPAVEPTAGGCPDYGYHRVTVRVINGAGLSTSASDKVPIEPAVWFEYPLPAKTGQPFTIRPVFSPGYVVPAGTVCRIEFRWGDTPSLRDNDFNDTFGFLLFEGTAADGFCGEWTFTLPWVPYPQFELSWRGPAQQLRSGEWPDREIFQAQVVGTDRRIRESNLPIAQVLPSTYTPTIGQPITYTRYLIGGASGAGAAVWTARLGTGEDPTRWERWTTSSTFTITPPHSGDLFVQWNRESDGRLLIAGYDPPVKPPDKSKPNTTAPIHQFNPGSSGTHVPVKVSWSGTDKGWGIKWYRLERSINGGAWTKVTLPTGTTTSIRQDLPPGSTVRFRVRATDKVGNVGSWDYGRTFRVDRIADTSPLIAYNAGWSWVTDATAAGGQLHETPTAGSAAYHRFTGSDVAWITEVGPLRGQAKVFIDGAYHSTVDLTAASWAPRRLVFRKHFASVGVHTIRIEAIGTAGRPTIGVDGFATLR